MEKEESIHKQQEYSVHRIATFGRKKLGEINLHYTGELFLGLKAKDLDKETAELYELGRRAFGHVRAGTRVYMIRKIDVYKTGPGVDDINVKVFMESDLTKS
ncbi:MAG: hypothetical protein A3B38_00840 [Candidatus Levybacteria bacterium RIFCSPLOWO2_01_FULL_36_13]|nr:MAG: hypothetical protein A2684_02080 [Candidatus Levybacteria bacterium RIFCSPHIGHO2_01_FULL_36_15b]OGH35435.1 MAG: hypothetical protein A3B38_00840 [Candidatus Levybacteria bacterium RIFCSPLOWO2_01_FULL_36_13]